MKNTSFIHEAFSTSTRGRILTSLEMFILVSIVFGIMGYFASHLYAQNVNLLALLLVSGFMGLSFGLIRLIEPYPFAFFIWKLFPPNEKTIEKYRIKRLGEISDAIQVKEAHIKRLRSEYKEIDTYESFCK